MNKMEAFWVIAALHQPLPIYICFVCKFLGCFHRVFLSRFSLLPHLNHWAILFVVYVFSRFFGVKSSDLSVGLISQLIGIYVSSTTNVWVALIWWDTFYSCDLNCFFFFWNLLNKKNKGVVRARMMIQLDVLKVKTLMNSTNWGIIHSYYLTCYHPPLVFSFCVFRIHLNISMYIFHVLWIEFGKARMRKNFYVRGEIPCELLLYIKKLIDILTSLFML